MTPEEQIDLIHFLLDEWRKSLLELTAFQATLNALRIENPQIETTLDKLLAAARRSETARKRVDAHLSGFEELLKTLGEGSLEKALREIQEKHGAKFPIN